MLPGCSKSNVWNTHTRRVVINRTFWDSTQIIEYSKNTPVDIFFLSPPHQGSSHPLLCQTPKQFMSRTSTTLGLSPQSKASNWKIRTRSFMTRLPRGTSPCPGRRRWSRWASTASSQCGGPTALCLMTCVESPSWHRRPSPPPAQCREEATVHGWFSVSSLLLLKLCFFSTFQYRGGVCLRRRGCDW